MIGLRKLRAHQCPSHVSQAAASASTNAKRNPTLLASPTLTRSTHVKITGFTESTYNETGTRHDVRLSQQLRACAASNALACHSFPDLTQASFDTIKAGPTRSTCLL